MKKTKQIISICLAVLMLASLFTVAANAADTLSTVNVKGVIEPMEGENPVFDALVPRNPFVISSVSWYDSGNEVLTADYKFVKDATYKAVVEVTPKSGYEFVSGVKAFINDLEAEITEYYPDKLVLSMTYVASEWYDRGVIDPENGDSVLVKPATETQEGLRQVISESNTNYWEYVTIKPCKFSVTNLNKLVYNGKTQYLTLKFANYSGDNALVYGSDYSVTYLSAHRDAGTYKMRVDFKNWFKGSKTITFKIAKAKNTVKISSKNMTVKYKTVKKKAVTVKPITVTKSVGKVTYKKLSGNKKLTVNTKTGKVTVKKGTKKGKYTLKVKVTSVGSKNYNSLSLTKTFKITVK